MSDDDDLATALAAAAAAAARAVLRSESFFATAGGHLTFDDLRALATSCKAGREGVAGFIRSMPLDVQRIVRHSSRLKYVLLEKGGELKHFEDYDTITGDYGYRLRKNPDPMLQFSFGSLAFDIEGKGGLHFRGDPWSGIAAKNAVPSKLGTAKKQICTANDGGTKIFVCGGVAACKSDKEWVHLRTSYDYFATSGVTALYDVETGIWERLPDMPMPRHSAGICRLDSRVYIIGGWHNNQFGQVDVQCFDLSKGKWVDSECQDFPSEFDVTYLVGMVAAKLNDHTIIYAGGHPMLRRGAGDPKQVFALDVTSGDWSRLADLPADMGADEGKYRGILVQSEADEDPSENSFVFMRGEKWARLLPSGEWELMPDLSGNLGSDVLEMENSRINHVDVVTTTLKLFTGKQWRRLDPGKCAKDEDWLMSEATALRL